MRRKNGEFDWWFGLSTPWRLSLIAILFLIAASIAYMDIEMWQAWGTLAATAFALALYEFASS